MFGVLNAKYLAFIISDAISLILMIVNKCLRKNKFDLGEILNLNVMNRLEDNKDRDDFSHAHIAIYFDSLDRVGWP